MQGHPNLLDYDWAEHFWALSFEMVRRLSYNESSGLLLDNEQGLDRVLENIDDVTLLGDAAFSRCHYITHWTYSLEHESVGLIVRMLRRMEKRVGSGGRKLEQD